MGEPNTELVSIFKALADANRLKIVGLLAQQPYSVEQLAALLNLKPPTVSHHLSKLAEVGLVSAKAEGYYSVYQLEEATLQKTRLLFSNRIFPPPWPIWIWTLTTEKSSTIIRRRMENLKQFQRSEKNWKPYCTMLSKHLSQANDIQRKM